MNSFAKLCLRNALASEQAQSCTGIAVERNLRNRWAEPAKIYRSWPCAALVATQRNQSGQPHLQTEYTAWILQDKHSRAYQAAPGDVGERMARILKLDARRKNRRSAWRVTPLCGSSAAGPQIWKYPRA